MICIPRDAFQQGRRLIEIIIDHAHQTIGHYGQWKTLNYIRCSYWWPQMATDIEAFCRSCGKCQTNKTNMQKPQGFLHSLPMPDKPWQSVGMDFMGPLPRSQGNDYLLVIIDWLTSQVHLIPTMMWVTAKEVAWLYLKEVVRLHRVPESIVSDHDTKFTSTFWHELHRLMGTKLLMSTVHSIPSTNRWCNRTGKPFYGANPKNDHQWSSEELGRQMPNGRICTEQ